MRTQALLQFCRRKSSLPSSSSSLLRKTFPIVNARSLPCEEKPHFQCSCCSCSYSSSTLLYSRVPFLTKQTSSSSTSTGLRYFSSKSSVHNEQQTDKQDKQGSSLQDDDLDGESTDGWEEEDEADPMIGDGGDGGGIVLGDIPWGEQVLSIANDVLLQFGDDMKLYSFKVSPRGYIYVRLDKVSNKYGCPTMDEMENYSSLYKKKLEEKGESGEIPDDLALEVSSPGAERILKVPDDLDRFKDMPMRVTYIETDLRGSSQQKDGVLMLESVDTESQECVWKLADVKENRDFLGKGRPLSRKQKDWRLRVPFEGVQMVTLYLEY